MKKQLNNNYGPMRLYLIALILFQGFIPHITAQDWVIPEDRKGKLSSFPFNDSTRNAGEKIFTVNCRACHGTPGKSNYLNLVPPPGDPVSEKIQRNSDGELFYKVTSGRGQMPSFRNVLTSEEVWDVISYFRSFNKSYKQEVMQVISSSAYPGSIIRMDLVLNKPENTILVNASAHKDNISVPVTDAGVRIYVRRTFGSMLLDEEKTTDKSGNAIFMIPDNLPGDSLGKVTISARFSDEDVYGTGTKDTILAAGTKIVPISLLINRAMWNNVRKAPVWILLTYIIGVFSAWGFIIIVLMKIRDIYIVGKHFRTDSGSGENID